MWRTRIGEFGKLPSIWTINNEWQREKLVLYIDFTALKGYNGTGTGPFLDVLHFGNYSREKEMKERFPQKAFLHDF